MRWFRSALAVDLVYPAHLLVVALVDTVMVMGSLGFGFETTAGSMMVENPRALAIRCLKLNLTSIGSTCGDK